MSAQIALSTTNALKASMVAKSRKIKRTTNFPLSLITKIRPFLKNRFRITKTLTRSQSRKFKHDMIAMDTSKNGLVIESEDDNILHQVDSTSRYIHHHSLMFDPIVSYSISPTASPSVDMFRRPEYRSEIQNISDKYESTVWCFDDINRFGIFSPNMHKQSACIRDIQRYVQLVLEQDLDYIQCDENCKRIFFNKSMNDSFPDLMNDCTNKYQWQYNICGKRRDSGYIWIWSKNKECRAYIKKFIEDELKQMHYKYTNIDDAKLSILFGRPYNRDENQLRYNEFVKTFKFDAEQKCNYFWNKSNKKCKFQYSFIPNVSSSSASRSHTACVVVNAKHYDTVHDAKQALEDIVYKLNESLNDNIAMIDCGIEYQCVLTKCFVDNIHHSILWDGDMHKIYIKHDNNGEYEQFKAMIFDRIIPNTLSVEADSHRKLNILQRVLVDKIGNNELQLLQQVINAKDTRSLVIYDEKLGNKEYRDNLNKIIDDIQNKEINTVHIEEEFVPMLLGQNGSNFEEMLEYCGINEAHREWVQIDADAKKLYCGFKETDEKIIKLKKLTQSVIDNCMTITLSPKQWRDWSQAREWKTKEFLEDFPKCCIRLCRTTADRMMFYGSTNVFQELQRHISNN